MSKKSITNTIEELVDVVAEQKLKDMGYDFDRKLGLARFLFYIDDNGYLWKPVKKVIKNKN